MSNTEPSYEPRRLQQLYEYWRSKFRGELLPVPQDIDPIEIPTLLSGLVLIAVADDGAGRRYRFRLLGNEFIDAVGENLTGRWLDDIGPLGSTDPVIATYEEAVTTKTPHCWENKIHVEDRHHVRYRRLICPLASDGGTVDMLVGIFAFERQIST